MYCAKCGKEARAGDTYCSGCGSKLSGGGPKKSNWLTVVLCAALVLSAVSVFGGNRDESSPPVSVEQEPTTSVQTVDELPAEPEDGDLLEESDYANGMPRRRISDYSDKYITDYRPDGTLLRETTLHYSSGAYGGKRVKNCDEYGNPTDETETMPDGSLWLYLYYVNSYDTQGRPLILSQYNRAGFPLYIRSYTYNADGSYRMDWTEYRGPVYEYDFEAGSQGTTTLAFEGWTTFTAEGDVIDQMINEVGA